MRRRLLTPMTLTLLSGGLLLSPLHADGSNNTNGAIAAKPGSTSVQIQDLHPFTHLAYIPAGADLSTARFEKVRVVQVPTKIRSTADPSYCEELAFREPGGSSYCPWTQTESPVAAYEVTYSFDGQPLPSDESGNRHFTFQVYFRTDELPADLRQAVSARKHNRADMAAYFNVSTYREPVQRLVIDEAQSKFCEGDFVDGAWTHTDRDCKDKISYTVVEVPSDYVTVKVDPVSQRVERAAIASVK